MNFLELSEKRYSCRSFSDKEVSPDLIKKIIQAGISAPTAVNSQAFKIFHATSEEAKGIIRESTSCHFDAPELLIVGYESDTSWVRPFDDMNFADIDASIVATHMMLEAEDLGLGSTWVGYFDAPFLQEKLPETKPYTLIALFPIGYPSETSEPSKRHYERKDYSEIVIDL